MHWVIAASAMVGSRIPPRRAWQLAAAGGTAEWMLRPRKRARLAENLAHAVGRSPRDPAVRRLVRAEFAHEARRSADFLWAFARPHEVAARCRVQGRPTLDAALGRGRGVILAGPHVGGYEVVAAGLGDLIPDRLVTVVVERDWVSFAVAGHRRRDNVELTLRTGSARAPLTTLAAGGVVVVVADMAKPGMRTCPVRFLDGRMQLPAGPAALSRLSGAPVVPFCVRPIAPRSWAVVLGPELEPPPRRDRSAEQPLVQALADQWSAWIGAEPELWEAVDALPWITSDAATAGLAPG
ncbi:MAG: lysophospholipid acyltransferase family protein [Gaiellales bacterium]